MGTIVIMLEQLMYWKAMSLADACLVRRSEMYRNATLATLDSDFLIYRRDRSSMIPIAMP
jgi:uncharacterized protein